MDGMSRENSVSIVIPAFNEAVRIVPTLEKIIDYIKKNLEEYEIIVVDDGSADSTVMQVQAFCKDNSHIKLLENGKNSGKGKAVQKGMLSARGEFIYFTDADLSTPVEEIDRFLKEIEDADIVIGSRSIDGAQVMVHEPFYREILGKLFNKIVRLFCVRGFIDTQCGAKMFQREAALKIFPLLKINGFAFDVEILYLAKRFGLKVKEIPVTWYYSADTKVKTFQHGFGMLLDLIRIRWLHRDDRLL